MSVKITYFVHGTTTDNETGKATGWLPGELSELGRKQAIELSVQAADKKFDAVYCSDLKRAVESANLGFGLKYKIVEDARLRECNYGDYSGAPQTFKDNMQWFVNNKFPNGESYKDVEVRLKSFISSLRESYDNQHIAIVAHQAPQLALEVLLKGRTWSQAIQEDWRRTKAWQPGWEYTVD